MENKNLKIVVLVILLLLIIISVFLVFAFKCNLFGIAEPNDNLNDDWNMSGETNINLEKVENYEVQPDGTKINNNKQIENAEFIFDKLKVSEFKITEINGSTTINGKVENMTDEEVKDLTLVVRLYNSADEVVHEYSLVISKIEPKAEQHIQTNVMADFANVARVEAEMQEGV